MSEGNQSPNSQSASEQPAPAAASGKLRYSAIKRLFLFLSKTDLHVLQFATPITEMTQVSIGVMVATTGILAFFSSRFAVDTAFFMGEDSFKSVVIPLLVALVYATAIVTFDREIVGVTEKKFLSSALRLVFAIILGIVISFPVELKVLQGKIDDQLTIELNKSHQGLFSERGYIQKRIHDEQESILHSFENDVADQQKLVRILAKQVEAEGNRVACRDLCKERERKLAAAQEKLQQLQTNQEKARMGLNDRFSAENAKIAAINESLRRDFNAGHDFLSQAMALDAITSQNSTALWMSRFLTAFFVLFELFPVLIKLSQPYNEYHAYLDARLEINKNKIFLLTNHKLAAWTEHPEHIPQSRAEFTDVIELVMEDRNMDIRNN